jgi:hypothetical protein
MTFPKDKNPGHFSASVRDISASRRFHANNINTYDDYSRLYTDCSYL